MSTKRPRMQHQGPADNCVIRGHELGWLSCTPYAMAMQADAVSFGHWRPDGCGLREQTGDVAGGMMLSQISPIFRAEGYPLELHVGANVCRPDYAARRLTVGRGFTLQGNTGALLGTRYKDTDGAINHAVYVHEALGGTSDEPEFALVYDPAADGRRPDISEGPTLWPWQTVLNFAARLHPNGESDPHVLGAGKFYCAISPTPPLLPDTDTEWHLGIKKGTKSIRTYEMQKAEPINCIKGWDDVPWNGKASSAACTRPVHRVTCDGTSGATTVKLLAGKFQGKYVLVGRGTYAFEV